MPEFERIVCRFYKIAQAELQVAFNALVVLGLQSAEGNDEQDD